MSRIMNRVVIVLYSRREGGFHLTYSNLFCLFSVKGLEQEWEVGNTRSACMQ